MNRRQYKESYGKSSVIQSPSNERIKEAVLLRKSHGRLSHEAFFLEGRRVVETALRAGVIFREIFYTIGFVGKEQNTALIEDLSRQGATLHPVAQRVMERLSDTDTAQGIAAVGASKGYCLEDIHLQAKDFIAVCDRVKDPGNLGSILRSADAFGCSAVVLLQGSCNPFSPKTIRASAGSVFALPVICTDTATLLHWVDTKSMSLLATLPKGGIPLYEAPLNESFALILGEEASGISPELIRHARYHVAVPMAGTAESLNVSICAALVFYETLRQRKRHPGGRKPEMKS